jgi:hypothetical protein
MSIPNEFLCPITAEIMRDPVIGTDGHTYERSAITAWLGSNAISPITRASMTVAGLTPNIAVRSQIDRLLGSNAGSSLPLFKNVPLSVTSELYKDTLHVHVEATGPQQRQPIVLLGILDKSGSMDECADLPGETESLGFTRLDLVKHAVRTLASILTDDDMFGIISFSTTADVDLRPTRMTAAGKRDLYNALDRITPNGGTNIWEGVRQASLIANEPQFAESNVVAMLLTDGLPNNNPPRGILPSMQALKKSNRWTLHTFGFGYQLDSDLLSQIADWGHGLFGFIPDCSMVGTVIINFMATALATASRGQELVIQDGTAMTILDTGAVIHGQARDYYVPVRAASVTVDGTSVPTVATPPADYGRHLYMDVLSKSISYAKTNSLLAATTVLATFEIQQAPEANAAMKAYLRDIRSTKDGEGQIGMAPQYFAKWGEHYMRSYLRAQNLQQCLNFKDPGLQIYGGDLFHTLQEAGDTAFVTLPAPRPSRPARSGVAAYATPVSMATFHNASGGCFAGHCRVRMANDSYIAIKDIHPGQQVWTPFGPAYVRALVTCGSYQRSQPMVQIERLCITAWHPIWNRISKRWQFPADIMPYNDRMIQTVYNLVLTTGHIVEVEGYECITLGHHIDEPIALHPFFGTECVIDDLKKLPGWQAGRPTFRNLVATRSPTTGLINRWIDEPDAL